MKKVMEIKLGSEGKTGRKGFEPSSATENSELEKLETVSFRGREEERMGIGVKRRRGESHWKRCLLSEVAVQKSSSLVNTCFEFPPRACCC